MSAATSVSALLLSTGDIVSRFSTGNSTFRGVLGRGRGVVWPTAMGRVDTVDRVSGWAARLLVAVPFNRGGDRVTCVVPPGEGIARGGAPALFGCTFVLLGPGTVERVATRVGALGGISGVGKL